jgi:hypothetical protein
MVKKKNKKLLRKNPLRILTSNNSGIKTAREKNDRSAIGYRYDVNLIQTTTSYTVF